ncbi:hypothetical protein B7486_47865 [cyanobacterium TDX16]|nr:hypothetical protein B7486_47865 [cyanobacterium TDX16]
MSAIYIKWNEKLGRVSFLATGVALACWVDSAIAQITPDNTMGGENSTVTSTGEVDAIDGGATRGANLFHSFQEFNVEDGRAAVFTSPNGIENILTRVTGANPSNILGTLGVAGNANLFLLNPNGIIFGANARLDVGGSFVGSTASSINFADGTSFSATAPTTPLLTISVPMGLQMGQNPRGIRVQGTGYDLSVQDPIRSPVIRGSSSTGLRVSQGKTLALVGGNVEIEGGTLTAEQGRIELGSVGGEGQVSLSPIPSGFTFNYQGVQRFGDIRLLQQALVDASGGGSIQVQGDRVSLTDGSLVLIQNQGLQGGGNISVNVAESLEASEINPDARLTGGLSSETIGGESGADIAIKTKQLVIQDGASIGARSRSSGKAGNVSVNATNSVQLIGFSLINPTFSSTISAPAYSSGDAGNIEVTTGQLTGLNGGQISSATFGTGQGGDITVDALDSIELVGQTSLFAPSSLNAVTLNAGDGGNLTVNTSRLAIRDGGNVSSSTLATGNAGSVTINAKETVEVSGRFPRSTTPTFVGSSAPILAGILQATYRIPPVPSGNSGDVTINTPKLSVTDSALVAVSNEGVGNAGTLRVNASSIFLDNRGGITAATVSGEGGNIFLNVQKLLLRNNSVITATAQGTGNGGNINIDTDLLVAFENSDISANSANFRGGNVRINAFGIFGTQFRAAPDDRTSDITATGGSPQLSGNVGAIR